MGRTIIAEASLEKYLEILLETESFSYGIIIGQPSRQGKDYVVHLAKTPEESLDDMNSQSSSTPSIKNIDSINAVQMIEHGLNALRQIPGSFFVLGIFVVSSQPITEQVEDMVKLKGILKQLVGGFRNNGNGCTDEYDDGEKLLFHFAGRRSFSCKSFNTTVVDTGSRKASSKPVDWKFQEKTTNWQQIETIFDTDYVLPLIRKANGKFSIDDNFQITVKTINEKLEECLVFVNGEPLNAFETLETYQKQKANRSNNDVPVILHGSLFQICKQHIEDDQSALTKYDGTIRYTGVICSKVWVHQKHLVGDIERFIKKDIMRSMVCRLRILLDSLDSSGGFDEDEADRPFKLHELPRRVFYELPTCPVICFSDYLFRDETVETVLQSAKDIMDVELNARNIFTDFETFGDGGTDNDSALDETDSTDSSVTGNSATGLMAKENLRLMYILGLIFAVGVLFVSIGIHFIFNYD